MINYLKTREQIMKQAIKLQRLYLYIKYCSYQEPQLQKYND